MHCPYQNYCLPQAGSGWYRGAAYQRGHGIIRISADIGKTAFFADDRCQNSRLKSGAQFVSDVVSGQNIKQSCQETRANTGLVKRREITAESKVVHIYCKALLDIFAQTKYLLDGVSLTLCFVRSPKNFKVAIKSMLLFIWKVRISPAVHLMNIRAVKKWNALYHITNRSQMMSVSSGSLSANVDYLFLGPLPKRIVLGCVGTNASNSTKSKGLFNFKHYSLDFLALNMNGQQNPAKAFKHNFCKKHNLQEYISLPTETRQFFKDEGNQISRDEFNFQFTYSSGFQTFWSRDPHSNSPHLLGNHWPVGNHWSIRSIYPGPERSFSSQYGQAQFDSNGNAFRCRVVNRPRFEDRTRPESDISCPNSAGCRQESQICWGSQDMRNDGVLVV